MMGSKQYLKLLWSLRRRACLALVMELTDDYRMVRAPSKNLQTLVKQKLIEVLLEDFGVACVRLTPLGVDFRDRRDRLRIEREDRHWNRDHPGQHRWEPKWLRRLRG